MLDLSANTIDDDAVRDLCDALIMVHNFSLQTLRLNETGVGPVGISAIIETMRLIPYITEVGIDKCKNVTQESREKLNVALRINKQQIAKETQINKMFDAGKKRDKYDAMGIGYDKGVLLK